MAHRVSPDQGARHPEATWDCPAWAGHKFHPTAAIRSPREPPSPTLCGHLHPSFATFRLGIFQAFGLRSMTVVRGRFFKPEACLDTPV